MTVDSRYYSLVVILRLVTQSRTMGIAAPLCRSRAIRLFGGPKPQSSSHYNDLVIASITSDDAGLLVRRWTMFRVSSEASLFGGTKPWHVLQGVCLHVEPAKQSWLATIPWCLGWDRSYLVLTGHCLVEITPFRWLSQMKTDG